MRGFLVGTLLTYQFKLNRNFYTINKKDKRGQTKENLEIWIAPFMQFYYC